METIKKYTLLAVLVAWGAISFLALCGEDTPGQTTSLWAFIIIKIIAMASLLLCAWVIRNTEKAGGFPDFWYANDDNKL